MFDNARRISRFLNARPKLTAIWFCICTVAGITLGVLTLSTASTRHNPAENRIGSIWFFFVATIALVLFIRALCRIRQR